jgi:hypothetical protein
MAEVGLLQSRSHRSIVCNLGASFLRSGDVIKAKTVLQECVSMFAANGEVNSEDYASALQNYALSLPDYARQVEVLTRALSLADALGLQGTNMYTVITNNVVVARKKLSS